MSLPFNLIVLVFLPVNNSQTGPSADRHVVINVSVHACVSVDDVGNDGVGSGNGKCFSGVSCAFKHFLLRLSCLPLPQMDQTRKTRLSH